MTWQTLWAGAISPDADLTRAKAYGTTANFRVSGGFAPADGLMLGGVAKAAYAGKEHMGRFFGVSAAQSVPSGRAACLRGFRGLIGGHWP